MRVAAEQMTRRLKSAALAGAVMVAPAAGALASAPTAQAAGGCSGPTGVTVVVQFPNGVAVGCGQAGIALNSLRSAGFSTVGSSRFGDNVLCGINGVPYSTPCPMPPTDKYWAVFTAPRGGTWAYLQGAGIGTKTMTNGSVLGLRLGDGAAPSMPVPGPVATPKRSTSTPKPTSTSSKQRSTTSATAAKSATSTGKSTSASRTPQTTSKQAAKPSTSAKSSQTSSSSTSKQQASSTSKASRTTAEPKVQATRAVTHGGTTKVEVTYSDGSKAVVSQQEAKGIKVGQTRTPSATSTSTASSTSPKAPASTSVAAPSTSPGSQPSISTSGEVPMPKAAEQESSGSGVTGLIVGGVAVSALAAGGAFLARRRG